MDQVRSAFAGRVTLLPGPSAMAAVVRVLCAWDARHRQRRALAALDEVRRADLALSVQSVRSELKKPFWQP